MSLQYTAAERLAFLLRYRGFEAGAFGSSVKIEKDEELEMKSIEAACHITLRRAVLIEDRGSHYEINIEEPQ